MSKESNVCNEAMGKRQHAMSKFRRATITETSVEDSKRRGTVAGVHETNRGSYNKNW